MQSSILWSPRSREVDPTRSRDEANKEAGPSDRKGTRSLGRFPLTDSIELISPGAVPSVEQQ